MKQIYAAVLVSSLATPLFAQVSSEHSRMVMEYYKFGNECNDGKTSSCAKSTDILAKLDAANVCFGAEVEAHYCKTNAQNAGTIAFSDRDVRRAFNMYYDEDRRFLQKHLKENGYYTSTIDGKYGPGTSRAIENMARDVARDRQLFFDMTSFDGVREAFGYILTSGR